MKSDSRNKQTAIATAARLVEDVKKILHQARQQAYTAVNSSMVQAYWLIGRRIVEDVQDGQERAEYGKQIISTLAMELTNEFGKGLDEREIRKIRQFYLTFPIRDAVSAELIFLSGSNPEIRDSLSPVSDQPSRSALQKDAASKAINYLFTRLSWTHIRHLLRVSDSKARDYYIKETAENNWSTRTLERNISSQYYQRLLASQVKEPVIAEMKEKTEAFQQNKYEFIKNPSVLEFLNLPGNLSHTESQIEKAIIDNLQHFLLELGKGYAFVERQKLIKTDARDYFIDLVFYNFILKCFVLIDLKTSRITHKDVGQMDMYVRMFDETIKNRDDNPTLGIVLCSETDHDIARYSILRGNEQIFASKYKLYLPTEEELAAEIAREKAHIRLQLEQEKEL
jgi:predicted nuclease of restriction endonuclease-like (RecB) superfamily